MKKTFRKLKQTHTVEIQNDKIIFTLALDGVQEHLTYDPVLYEILSMDRLKPFRNNGRLRISVHENGADFKFYIYDLARACYDGRVRTGSFIKDMQSFYDYKNDNDLDIDHLDNNVHNNTCGNIVLMDAALNRKKSAITARFRPPFYLNSVYCNDEFRIQFLNIPDNKYIENILRAVGLNMKAGGQLQLGIHFRCTTAEDYVECLYFLAESSYAWCLPGITPKQHHTANKDLECWASTINNSLHAQKILSKMMQEEFQLFPCRKEDGLEIA